MSYQVIIPKPVQKQLDALPGELSVGCLTNYIVACRGTALLCPKECIGLNREPLYKYCIGAQRFALRSYRLSTC
jgi:hypothetical protein